MDQQILTAASAYVRDYVNEPKRLDALRKLLEARPEVEAVVSLVPLDEHEARLDAIISIRDEHRRINQDSTFEFTRVQFFYLIRMSVADLRSTMPLVTHYTTWFLDLCTLTDYFLLKPPHVSQLTQSGTATQTPKTAPRNNSEKTKCLNFDNRVCIVTGAPDPHVCHIIPFAWNKTTNHTQKAQRLKPVIANHLGLLNDSHTSRLMAKLCELRGSDEVWNMLCLNPTLNDWWGRAYFGFKYLGAYPIPEQENTSSIKLQLVWMPRHVNNGESLKTIKPEEQRDPHTQFSQTLIHYHGWGSTSCPVSNCTTCAHVKRVMSQDVQTSHPVLTGSIFRVTRDTDHVEMFKRVIDIQWAIICAASLSGRAQDVELHLDQDEDEQGQEASLGGEEILDWVEGSEEILDWA